MLLLKSIASRHSTLGGKILLNLTSSADSEQVKAWMQMAVEKQGETDQRGGTGPSTTAQKEVQGGEQAAGHTLKHLPEKAPAAHIFTINTKALSP